MTNKEIIQILKSKPKKISILCTFNLRPMPKYSAKVPRKKIGKEDQVACLLLFISVSTPLLADRSKVSTCHRDRRNTKREGRKVTVGECSKLHRQQSYVVFPTILGPWVALCTVLYLVLHPAGEALVEPEIVPPAHGDEVAEPLVRQLVGNHHCHPLLRARARLTALVQQGRLSVTKHWRVHFITATHC